MPGDLAPLEMSPCSFEMSAGLSGWSQRDRRRCRVSEDSLSQLLPETDEAYGPGSAPNCNPEKHILLRELHRSQLQPNQDKLQSRVTTNGQIKYWPTDEGYSRARLFVQLAVPDTARLSGKFSSAVWDIEPLIWWGRVLG
ncbi:hypothetical protein DPEC_G00119010 [Dallia pectoralis]|uniref:Uncharacterized protein n=1 Tax=Dallia pectoralis TaxID=75939 RepID=A0ACC2GQ51_DALPE|nr:hypothetical protein DPEC_G00119010 [Dallia pectoralis]